MVGNKDKVKDKESSNESEEQWLVPVRSQKNIFGVIRMKVRIYTYVRMSEYKSDAKDARDSAPNNILSSSSSAAAAFYDNIIAAREVVVKFSSLLSPLLLTSTLSDSLKTSDRYL